MRLIKNRLITGTLMLTCAGLATRVLGFFYRMFLSRAFSEEEMGIYQLLSPIMALSFSITAAGIQTALSKCIAACQGKHENSIRIHILQIASLLSVFLSIVLGFLIFEYAAPISEHFLLEARCAPLLKIFALSLPLSSVHSCVNGYYYGIKKTAVPALSQLLEQLARVGFVYFICLVAYERNYTPTISFAVFGLVAGECASMLVCVLSISFYCKKEHILSNPQLPESELNTYKILKDILSFALPLTFSRLILNLIQSIEAIYIPNRLVLYGLSSKDALSLYGVLTGMAFPLIFAPSTLTNSLSVLLLPYISEADAKNNKNRIVSAFRKCLFGCAALGIFCGICFFLFGDFFGNLLFQNERAGRYIISLSYICPFLYLGGVLTSILHGLGKATTVFFFQLISVLIRLFFVFFAIPIMGIQGYLIGILVSQLVFCILIFVALKDYIYYNITR